ncbi:MAG: ankyrin, partial [Edafosvirus sp.]
IDNMTIDINYNDDHYIGSALLLLCANKQMVSDVNQIIKRSDININVINGCGESALIISVTEQNKNVIRYLLKTKININIQDANGNTALMYLCQQDDYLINYAITLINDPNVNLYLKNRQGLIQIFIMMN